MILWQASAYCAIPNPFWLGQLSSSSVEIGTLAFDTLELNPKFGRDGATTWKHGPSESVSSNGSNFDTSMKLPGPGQCESRVLMF